MDPKTSINILRQALDTYGFDHQRILTFEECGELINALAKFSRGRSTAQDVITELADVSIMIDQMAIHFGADAVRAERHRKLERLAERINNNQ